MLRCYEFEDVERHWISAPSEAEARRILEQHFGPDDEPMHVTVLSPSKMLAVRPEDDPPPTAKHYYEDTIQNWCQHVGIGLIASTVY